MAVSMYQASVPVFIRMLTNLAALLEKASAHAEARKIDPAVLLQSRLAPDMYPLVRQVQIVSDTVKGGAARLAGIDPSKFEDQEATFADLRDRIDRTIAFLNTLTPAQIDGSEDRTITLKVRDHTLTFKGLAYLLQYVQPNLYFHTSIAYGIMRHCGVELGKRDYLGKF